MSTDTDWFSDMLNEQKARVLHVAAGGLPQPQDEPKPPSEFKPFDVYVKLNELYPGINRGQTLREAKRMIELGFAFEDIVGCANFLLNDPWRVERGVPLTASAIIQRLPAWKKSQEQRQQQSGGWAPLGGG